MSRLKIIASVIISICLLHVAIAQDYEVRVDSLFAQWEGVQGPGATVAVIQDGEIILSKGYGAANIEYGIANTPATIFHVASVSKQFTVYAVMLLEKEGKLSWEDDIRKYIPEMPDFGNSAHVATFCHSYQWYARSMESAGIGGLAYG